MASSYNQRSSSSGSPRRQPNKNSRPGESRPRTNTSGTRRADYNRAPVNLASSSTRQNSARTSRSYNPQSTSTSNSGYRTSNRSAQSYSERSQTRPSSARSANTRRTNDRPRSGSSYTSSNRRTTQLRSYGSQRVTSERAPQRRTSQGQLNTGLKLAGSARSYNANERRPDPDRLYRDRNGSSTHNSSYASRSSGAGARNTRSSSGRSRSGGLIDTRARSGSGQGRGSSHNSARFRTNNGKFFGLVFLLIVLIIAIVVGTIFVRTSSLFKIQSITVAPTEHLSESDIASYISIPASTTLFTLDEQALKDALIEDPWVSSVEVDKKFPNSLSVAVTEEVIAAVVIAPSGSQAWYVSKSGRWIDQIDLIDQTKAVDEALEKAGLSREPEEAPAVTNSMTQEELDETYARQNEIAANNAKREEVIAQASSTIPSVRQQSLEIAKSLGVILIEDLSETAIPEGGKYVSDSGIEGVLKYEEGFTEPLNSMIVIYDAPSSAAISMTLSAGIQVSLGDPTDIPDKQSVILAMMDTYEGEVVYINVRVPSAPTWRGLGGSSSGSSTDESTAEGTA